MADWPILGHCARINDDSFDASGAAAQGLQLTTNNSYVEIFSAAENTSGADGIYVYHGLASTGGTAPRGVLVSIAIGEAASETVIVPNLLMHYSDTQSDFFSQMYIPIKIPRGVRVAVKADGPDTSQSIRFGLLMCQGSSFNRSSMMSRVTDYGTDEANQKGVSVPRTTAHTWSNWVEIDSAIENPIKAVGFGACRNTGSWSGASIRVRLAVGPSGNEEVVMSGHLMKTTSNEFGHNLLGGMYPVSIPAGSRIALSTMGSVNNTDLDFTYIVYGAD